MEDCCRGFVVDSRGAVGALLRCTGDAFNGVLLRWASTANPADASVCGRRTGWLEAGEVCDDCAGRLRGASTYRPPSCGQLARSPSSASDDKEIACVKYVPWSKPEIDIV